jgi:alkylation response protein AidB-like acyl-CoA dehydrogenase
MLEHWTDEQIELRSAVTEWARSIGAGAGEREKSGEFDWNAWQLIKQCGILRLPFEEAYGGLHRDLVTTLYLLEGFGYGCEDGGLSFVISTQIVSSGISISRFGTPQQKARFLPGICDGTLIGAHAITEPAGGSDAFQMKTRAVKNDSCYVLNGSKTFISNAPVADLIIVYAMTDPERGALGGVSVFIVEKNTPGLSIGNPLEKMGLKSAPMSEVFFSDCAVPEVNRLGNAGMGFPILDYVMKWEILCSFAINIGEMSRRLERCIEYAKMRKQFGNPIGSYQAISHKLANMKTSLETARLWLYRTAEKFQAKKNIGLDLAITKLLTSESNVDSALDAIQIFGGYGYMVEYGLERELRNAVAGRIYSGTSEIQRNRIAKLIGL